MNQYVVIFNMMTKDDCTERGNFDRIFSFVIKDNSDKEALNQAIFLLFQEMYYLDVLSIVDDINDETITRSENYQKLYLAFKQYFDYETDEDIEPPEFELDINIIRELFWDLLQKNYFVRLLKIE